MSLENKPEQVAELDMAKKAKLRVGEGVNMTSGPLNIMRRGADRRRANERRNDPRQDSVKKSLAAWIRSILKPRVGLDRRKGTDRRQVTHRPSASSLSVELSPDELRQLLK